VDDELDEQVVAKQRREQLLRLVAKGFYRELVKYGMQGSEVMSVASHLLDNLVPPSARGPRHSEYYSDLFTLEDVDDQWQKQRRLVVQQVTLRPLERAGLGAVVEWLQDPEVGTEFVPAFPSELAALDRYFDDSSREYFSILWEGNPVGIVGAENIDAVNQKLEMRKLVAERGRGIGKWATFAFLYHAFMVRDAHKVYVHSREINVRNLNLNSRFGFELEGVFYEELKQHDHFADIVRMALLKPRWLSIFKKS
jgi:RimJ/RimL family protein N-acetyltransferase